ncbi:DUF4381 domain-containing protein [Methylomonas sp. MgM2]
MEPLPLKDIHLPDTIGWWPPAPGWWLSLVALAILIVLARYGYKRRTRKNAVKSAHHLLKGIRNQSADPKRTLTELSALLRRTAISTGRRDRIAGLNGAAWLDFLDQSLPDSPFSQGIGRCLADAHFRPSSADDIDFDALFALCERWLKQQGKNS